MNHGYADWSSHFLDWAKKLGDRHTAYGSLRRTDRFDQKDTELAAGLYYPLAKRWMLQVEGIVSPTHNILAKRSMFGELGYSFDGGWGAYLGVRHTVYNDALTNAMIATVERYWSNYRLAYTQASTHLAGSGLAEDGRLQFSIYFDDRNFVGVSYSNGSEIENLGFPRGILTTHVRTISLRGRYWLNREWAAGYELATVRQGSFYTRNVFRLGLRRQF